MSDGNEGRPDEAQSSLRRPLFGLSNGADFREAASRVGGCLSPLVATACTMQTVTRHRRPRERWRQLRAATIVALSFLALKDEACRASGQSEVPRVHVMKPFRSTAALVVLAAGCCSTSPPAPRQTVQPLQADTYTCTPSANHNATRAEVASNPPRLRVGVSDPDTQLILPWFLTDIINAVNTRESVSDLLHTMRCGF